MVRKVDEVATHSVVLITRCSGNMLVTYYHLMCSRLPDCSVCLCISPHTVRLFCLRELGVET